MVGHGAAAPRGGCGIPTSVQVGLRSAAEGAERREVEGKNRSQKICIQILDFKKVLFKSTVRWFLLFVCFSQQVAIAAVCLN